mmetsp:Transcript_22774/g.43780  ORF Transcript_22774/g.43780 Transcript_22774/m.43780 type:complete len:175 (+) Transcript_22774:113-637(+)
MGGKAGKAKEECVIKLDDKRLDGHTVWFDVNNLQCKLEIIAESAPAGGTGSQGLGPRQSLASVFSDVETIWAAIVVTDKMMLLDCKRPKKDTVQQQYLMVEYTDPLCKEVDLSFTQEAEGPHLSVMLPYAKQFLKQSGQNLKMPDNATLRVDMMTWKAPDICMHVKGELLKLKK